MKRIRVLIALSIMALFIASCGSDDAVDVAATTTETAESIETAESTTTDSAAIGPVEVAIQFWEALVDRDRDATLALADPAVIESESLAPPGRANTLAGQFDWYEIVGWEWTLEECGEAVEGAVECMASASNTWSDLLGVDPVTGTFLVEVSDDGVTAVIEQADSFFSQWGPLVFEVFAQWVVDNHPADAAGMFNPTIDVNDEILGLYEVNTSRFVEAQSDG